jgi:hypothetical protein
MGCRKFRNYKHLLQVSRDGKWVDGGKFPSSLGSYTTIPKAKQGSLLNCTKYRYLDAVHIDIAFGNGVSVGGYCYALILVNRATQYIIGLLASRLSPQQTLYLHSISSMLRLVCWHVAFTWTAISNCLVRRSANI